MSAPCGTASAYINNASEPAKQFAGCEHAWLAVLELSVSVRASRTMRRVPQKTPESQVRRKPGFRRRQRFLQSLHDLDELFDLPRGTVARSLRLRFDQPRALFKKCSALLLLVEISRRSPRWDELRQTLCRGRGLPEEFSSVGCALRFVEEFSAKLDSEHVRRCASDYYRMLADVVAEQKLGPDEGRAWFTSAVSDLGGRKPCEVATDLPGVAEVLRVLRQHPDPTRA